MEFVSFALGPLQTNCFLFHNGKEAAVIDPGGDPTQVINYLKSHRLKLEYILNTHLHFDHIIGNKALKDASGAHILANERDSFLLDNPAATFGYPPVESFEYINMDEGETNFIGFKCQILATPGHTPGSLSYYFPEGNVVFAGDVLFYRSVGRTDFEGGSSKLISESIREKLYKLPDQTVVCPGHGPDTAIGDEKRSNPFYRAS